MNTSSNGNSKLRLSAWLKDRLHCGKPGIVWVNEQRGEFKLPWAHKARSQNNGKDIFTEWAKHTGLYEKASLKKKDCFSQFKANLRSALNKAPDIQNLQSSNDERVYKFLSKRDKRALEAELPKQDTSDVSELQAGVIVPLVVEQEFVSTESTESNGGQPNLDWTTDGNDSNSSTHDAASGHSQCTETEYCDIQDILSQIDCNSNGDNTVGEFRPSSNSHMHTADPYPIYNAGGHEGMSVMHHQSESEKLDNNMMSLGSDRFPDLMAVIDTSVEDLGSLPSDLKYIPVQPLQCVSVASNCDNDKPATTMCKERANPGQTYHDCATEESKVLDSSNTFLTSSHYCPERVIATNLFIEVAYMDRLLASYHAENPNGCIIAYKRVSEEKLIKLLGKNRIAEFYGEGYERKQFIDLEPAMSNHRDSFPDIKAFTKCLKRGISLEYQGGDIILERNTSLKISVKSTLDGEAKMLPSRSVQTRHVIFSAKEFYSALRDYINGSQKPSPNPSVYLCLTEIKTGSANGCSGTSMELVIRVTSCEALHYLQSLKPKACAQDRHNEELTSVLTSLDILSIE